MSHRPLPDFLWEVKWELDWLLTTQQSSGGVPHKLTALNFEAFIMPDRDNSKRYFTGIGTSATADFVAVMAQAARVYQPYAPTDAKSYLDAAQLGWSYLTANAGPAIPANNSDFTTGAYQSETTWNDTFGSSGGGFSTVYPRPAFQLGLHTPNARGVPDVAYNGDVNGGVLVVWSESGQGANLVFLFGGTSAGSPQWAGIAALTDQAAHLRVGDINPALYIISHTLLYKAVFHDVTVGTNIWAPSGVTAGFSAGKGWDPVTGLGTPNVGHLVPVLAAG